jgi:prepilin-type N-terminal cleavage/methylation domain-containing protein
MTRRGMSLIEMLVVMAVVAIVIAVGAPVLSSVFDLQQRGAAKTLAEAYKLLQTEAMLRNVTFRVAYNLDRGTWAVDVGDPSALIFSDPSTREAWEEEQKRKLKSFTKKDIEEGKANDVLGGDGRFTGLQNSGFPTGGELPSSCRFAYVYTPQYGQPVTPSEKQPESAEDERVVYSHIFPDGTMEFTVVRIVDVNDPADGYTMEVEPFSGEVKLDTEETEIGADLAWIPSEAPTSK